jgi:hypothetical protein
MFDRRIEIHKRFAFCFHTADQTVQTPKALQLFCMSETSGIQRPAQDGERLIVGLERYGKWVAVFAPESE